MTTILIPTHVGDRHALAVSVGLEMIGGKPIRLHGADFPSLQGHCLEIDERGFRWSAQGAGLDVSDDRIDVVWARRVHPPVMPKGRLHPDDERLNEQELGVYFRSLWMAVAERAVWVNARAAQYRVSSKLLQLRVARELGFVIPRTIVTNDRNRIVTFIRSADAGAIHKTFNAMGVRSESGTTVFETATFTEDDLPSEAVQRLTIGIVQERVAKAYETRVVVFGRAFYALRIDSQSQGETAVDYRHHRMSDLPTSAIEVPESVRELCLRFMDAFGILFGAFDFIVTATGDWVFLEVNEAGQFLFMEEAVPEMRILAGFCEFLMRPARDFLPSAGKSPSLPEVYASEAFRLACLEDKSDHVMPIR